MSLLLDARKKTQQAQSAPGKDTGLSGLEIAQGTYQDSHPLDDPRSAGRNLFNAKDPALPRSGINRNLLIALGGTVVLLAAGAGYVWYVISAGNSLPQSAISNQSVASLPKPVITPQNITAQENVPPNIVPPNTTGAVQPEHAPRPVARKQLTRPKNDSMRIQQQAQPIDPILNTAYLAYRNGKFEQAQELYRDVLKLDARNIDALLGLAVIAHHRGSDDEAAYYYAQALTLDPRNAVANAGMAALTTDDNSESRLKHLLNEQQDSSSLHFALGNHYAEKSRWGEAQQSYSNAYKLDPDNTEIAFNLAVSLDRLGQNKSAVQYYLRALKLDTSNNAGLDHAQIELRVQELSR